MLEIYKRIRARREELGISQEELAKRLGYKSRSSINKIEKGENDIPQSKIVAFAQALQTTPERLMGWEQSTESPDIPKLPNIEPYNPTMIPIVGTIAAGTPILAEENIEGYAPLQDRAADFALTVKGDSMIGDNIHPGDIVFIRQQPTVEIGEIAAVLIDGDATLKHFYRDADSVTLVSSNTKYKPMVYHKGDCDEIRILGKAVAYLHDLE